MRTRCAGVRARLPQPLCPSRGMDGWPSQILPYLLVYPMEIAPSPSPCLSTNVPRPSAGDRCPTPIQRSVNRSTIDQSTNQSIRQSINNQSTNQYISISSYSNQWWNQPVIQAVNQVSSQLQSINQLTPESTNQPNDNQSAIRQVVKSTNDSINQPVFSSNQSANQPTAQATRQPITVSQSTK